MVLDLATLSAKYKQPHGQEKLRSSAGKVSHFILPDHFQEVNRITHETHTNHYLLNFLIYKVHLHEVRINS